jgi:hypothetical protein
MQEQERQEPRRQLDTARACAKDLIRPYVLDDWTSKEISKGHMGHGGPDYYAQVGATSGYLIDHQGTRRSVNSQQVIVTNMGDTPCWAVFDLLELMAEIKDEAKGYRQISIDDLFSQEPEPAPAPEPEEEEEEEENPRSLAAIFAQEPAAAAPSKRAVVYRSYYGGSCQNPACGADLGYIETDGGRDRLYCNDACRVAAHRKRKSAEKRAAILQYNAELREYWYEHRIEDQLLAMLQEILIKHGKAAARAATDAVLFAQRDQIQRMGLANQYRPEPPRPPRSTGRE